MHQRNFRHQEVLAEQLQGALNSRVAIEQAKGMLAGRLGLDIAQAFGLLRSGAGAEPAAGRAGAVPEGSEDAARWEAVRSSRSA